MITGSTAITLLESLQDDQMDLPVVVMTGDSVILTMKHPHTYETMLQSVRKIVEGGLDAPLQLLCQDGKHYRIDDLIYHAPINTPVFKTIQLYNYKN
jgi:hypothetical protein